MMQRFLTKYSLALHIAAIVVFPLIDSVLNRTRVLGLIPLLWLSLFALELMILLPSVRRDESLADARRRVARALVWDPGVYIVVAIVVMVLIQWCNGGCKLVYLADADIWQYSQPAVTWAPFCIEVRAGSEYLALFSACAVIGIVLRNAVSKAAKRVLLQWVATSSGLAAILALVSHHAKGGTVVALTPGDSALGTVFGVWLVVGIGVCLDALAQHQRWTGVLFCFAVLGNLAGVLVFGSVFATVCYVVVALLLLFAYGVAYVGPHTGKHMQFKLFFGSFAVVAATALLLIYVFPQNPVVDKMKAAYPLAPYLERYSEMRDVRVSAALNIWQEHPWRGVGADGFRHYVGIMVGIKDWALLKDAPDCVFNDWLQFLCEFGVLGAGLLIAAVITVVVPICYRARVAWKFGTSDENEGRPYLLRLSPIVVAGVLSTTICAVESWFSSPFRFSGLLVSWVCVMVSLPAFLPARARIKAGGS